VTGAAGRYARKMSIEIRPVTKEGFAELEPMLAAYQTFYEVEDIDPDRNREFFGRFIGPNEEGWLLGAYDGGALVGFGCFYRHKSSLTATDIVLMNDLFVDETARGKGAGRALIEAGRDLAKQWGASHLTWSTAPDNRTAQALYDSTGAGKSTWLEYELEI
jgi:GNAT superfamily N-acetyltransferase